MTTFRGPSLRGRLLIAEMRLLNRKKVFADPGALRRSADSGRRHDREEPTPWSHRDVAVSRREFGGITCHLFEPKAPVSAKRVLYFHGGAYVHQIQRDHWHFVRRLVRESGASVLVPVYPLAPDSTCAQTLPKIFRMYEEAFGSVDPAFQVFMGDSAGGGLSLVLAQHLRERDRPQPKEIVLLCPWLDLTTSDPALAGLDPADPYLSPPGLLAAARLYAGDLDLADPRLSPLNGPLDGLGALHVFAGTRDVLLADARRLRTAAAEAGIPLGYWEYEGMVHAWMLTTLPEARDATRRIAHLIRR